MWLPRELLPSEVCTQSSDPRRSEGRSVLSWPGDRCGEMLKDWRARAVVGSQIVVCKPAPSVSLGGLPKITLLKLHRALTESEILGVGPSNLHTSLLGDCEACSILRNTELGYSWWRAAGVVKGVYTWLQEPHWIKRTAVLNEQNNLRDIYLGVVSSYSICEGRTRFPVFPLKDRPVRRMIKNKNVVVIS